MDLHEGHIQYMQRCLQLARLGLGSVQPNPMVGAVIVHNGLIIGEGYHHRYGESHAEVNALASVKDKSLLAESTLYVDTSSYYILGLKKLSSHGLQVIIYFVNYKLSLMYKLSPCGLQAPCGRFNYLLYLTIYFFPFWI